MHISEGILPLSWALFWGGVSATVLGISLRGLKNQIEKNTEKKALFAFTTALIFLISVIPIPVPFVGTCSHPVGVGVGVFIMGLAGSIVGGFIVLLLQALFLAHGGISSLGANVFSMAIGGSVAAYLVVKITKNAGLPLYMRGFLAGILADWVTYLITALQLSLALKGNDPLGSFFLKILFAFLPTQLPLGILEGVITGALITAIAKRRVDLLEVAR